ncbi:MAG: RNA-binding protein [Clostridia bacterium]|nr:RNA-binding protein [Clostridia bacterium]
MHLDPDAFERMEDEQKTVELRLYDEKRRRIQAGDVIRFESTDDDTDVLFARVTGMRFFASFDELYAALPLAACGYAPEELATASPRDMDKYYSPEAQQKWGVVGIELSFDF